MTPRGGLVGVIAGIAVSAAVSFGVNALILKATVRETDEVVVPASATVDPSPATA